ncbi:hypothetical protein MRX96_010367 [Rhipicephalus microplus]
MAKVQEKGAVLELMGCEEVTASTPRNIIKNVVTMSFSFLLLFTAFQSVSNLQSSINSVQGLGTFTMATIYVALVLSCMFVPPLMIRKLNLKCTLVVSMAMYVFYFIANFYPTWATLLPASIVMGLGGAPLWTAKCAYLTTVANDYAAQTRQKAGRRCDPLLRALLHDLSNGSDMGGTSSHITCSNRPAGRLTPAQISTAAGFVL